MKETDQVLEAIEQLANTSGKAKQALLGEFLSESPLMLKVLKATYDPFITYGVKKIPKRSELSLNGAQFGCTQEVWSLLDRLANRTLTGNAALAEIEVTMNKLSAPSAELLRRILIKDMRAGFTAKSVNKAAPGSIFVFECMLSHKYEEKRIKEWPVAVEPKYDGVRALLIQRENHIGIYSRTGKLFSGMQHIIDSFLEHCPHLTNIVIDGELISDSGFNEIVGAVHRKDKESSESIFMIFDILTVDEFENDLCQKHYLRRRKSIASLFKSHLPEDSPFDLAPSGLAVNSRQVERIYQAIRDAGGEGVIVKPLDGKYECKRSYNWLKIKDRQTVDIPVIGFEEGTGKNVGKLGALVCDLNGVSVKVGGGLSDDLREKVWRNKGNYSGKLVEVEYHEMTPDLSLRHPRFMKFREDKPFEDGVGV